LIVSVRETRDRLSPNEVCHARPL